MTEPNGRIEYPSEFNSTIVVGIFNISSSLNNLKDWETIEQDQRMKKAVHGKGFACCFRWAKGRHVGSLIKTRPKPPWRAAASTNATRQKNKASKLANSLYKIMKSPFQNNQTHYYPHGSTGAFCLLLSLDLDKHRYQPRPAAAQSRRRRIRNY